MSIHITTTDWKKKFEDKEGKLKYLLEYYGNLSHSEDPVYEIIEVIDYVQYQTYYTAVKEDLEDILNEPSMTSDVKVERIKEYLDCLL